METNPPGANHPLSNLAQSYPSTVKANNATLLFWVISNFKSNKMVAVKVHETFDFAEIESVTILRSYLKISKKAAVLIRTRKNLLSGDPLFGESRRTPPKQKGKKDRRLIAG